MLLLLALACQEPVDDFAPPEPPAHGVQVRVPLFELDAYSERERCLFLNADNATAGHVTRIELVAREGIHHAFVSKAPEDLPDEEVECFGLPEEIMDDYTQVPEPLFASSTQVPDEVVDFPDGIGVPFAAGQQLVFDYHYVNPTDAPMPAEIYLNLHFAEDDAEITPAQLYAFGNITGIDVPAGGIQELTTTCTVDEDIELLTMTPHMHQLATGFRAGTTGGEPVLETTTWDNPSTLWLDPPLQLSAGEGLTFTCSWDNPGDEAVHFGPTADDEMCFVFGWYTPGEELLWRADYDGACVTD